MWAIPTILPGTQGQTNHPAGGNDGDACRTRAGSFFTGERRVRPPAHRARCEGGPPLLVRSFSARMHHRADKHVGMWQQCWFLH
eukprot:gene25628-biopygen3004